MRPDGRRHHAGHHLDQRRLAGAVVADQADDLVPADGEIDVAQRLDGAEILLHALEADDVMRRRRRRRRHLQCPLHQNPPEGTSTASSRCSLPHAITQASQSGYRESRCAPAETRFGFAAHACSISSCTLRVLSARIGVPIARDKMRAMQSARADRRTGDTGDASERPYGKSRSGLAARRRSRGRPRCRSHRREERRDRYTRARTACVASAPARR